MINSLGMEALIDALVASTKVEEGEGEGEGEAAAKPTAQVKVTQKIPGVKPSDLDTAQLSSGEQRTGARASLAARAGPAASGLVAWETCSLPS